MIRANHAFSQVNQEAGIGQRAIREGRKPKNSKPAGKTEGDYPTGDARFDKFIKFVFTHENVLGKDGKVVPENVAGDNGGLTR